MVNTPLSPSRGPLGASLTVSVSILMGGWYSRNLRGDCRPSSLTCCKPWHRPSRPADQHWLLGRRSETLESTLVALFFGRLREPITSVTSITLEQGSVGAREGVRVALSWGVEGCTQAVHISSVT